MHERASIPKMIWRCLLRILRMFGLRRRNTGEEGAAAEARSPIADEEAENSDVLLGPELAKDTRHLDSGVSSWTGDRRPSQNEGDSFFQVQGRFPGVSSYSVKWAQEFVNAALSYNGTKAFQNDQGVGFEPNFVFIERIYTREDGFIASFYGPPRKFYDAGIHVEPGRSRSYSRLRVKSTSDLNVALRALELSAKFKGLTRKV
jgi:hypothetical protein